MVFSIIRQDDMNFRIVIFANGPLPQLTAVRRILHPDDILVAADGGAHLARSLGLIPAVIVGDLDSLSSSDRRWAEQHPILLKEHPKDKDETDLELATAYALEQGCREIVITGATGGRLDQTLANLWLLTSPLFNGVDIRLDDGLEQAWFIRNETEILGQTGDVVSLLPWGGPVAGVITAGLRWPLAGEPLQPDRTRGISNEMLGARATVRIQSGLLLVIHARSIEEK
jgi:thiamine pyrophosphokinase